MINKKSKPVQNQQAPATGDENGQRIDLEAFLEFNGGKSLLEYSANRIIFWQGDPADSVYYVWQGVVKHSVTSPNGKEAIVALAETGDFLGEGCLANQPLRMETAVTVTDCVLVRIEKSVMARSLQEQNGIPKLFANYLLSRNIRFQKDLIDQLFNCSEKRLARILLLLARFPKESETAAVLPRIKQEHLSQMVGTTRSRVSYFMNQFRSCGYIDYNKSGQLRVHRGLLGVLHDTRG